MQHPTASQSSEAGALGRPAAMPTRPAAIQVLDRTAYVRDFETGETLFSGDLNTPGAAGALFRGCWRRGYETNQLRQDAKGRWRFYRPSGKDRP